MRFASHPPLVPVRVVALEDRFSDHNPARCTEETLPAHRRGLPPPDSKEEGHKDTQHDEKERESTGASHLIILPCPNSVSAVFT
jgi:hypothetical protein